MSVARQERVKDWIERLAWDDGSVVCSASVRRDRMNGRLVVVSRCLVSLRIR